MLTGLMHSHSGLAYLLLLSTSLSLGLALLNGALGSKPGLVKAGTIMARKVEPALMGIIALIGIATWFMMGLSIATPYLWVAFIVVAVHGMLTARVLKPILLALAGGDASVRWRWPAVALVTNVLVYGTFGLMHAY